MVFGEISDDMCCQSSELLPEISTQASQLSLGDELHGVRRRGVSFAENFDDNERARDREEHMREVQEKEREIERAAEAAWEEEMTGKGDGTDEDEDQHSLHSVESKRTEEGSMDEEECEDEDHGEGEDGEENEEDGAHGDNESDEDDGDDEEDELHEGDHMRTADESVRMSTTSPANHSFDIATENLDAFEFVKLAPRSPQGYDPRQHPLILNSTNTEGEATFAVTAMTEKGGHIEPFASPPRDHRAPINVDDEVESRPQTGFTEMSDDSPRHSADRDEPLSPIVKGAVECDGKYFDPSGDNGVQAYLKAWQAGDESEATYVNASANSTLTELRLDDNNIAADGAAALFDAMAFSNTVRALYMSSNQKMAPALKPLELLADAPPHSAHEAEEGERSREEEDVERAGLTGWIAKASSLTCLDLSNCKLGDEGVKAIASALARNENDSLASLYLGSNQVTDAGAGVLFSVLARCGNICVRDIDLQWNRLRDASHLADAISRNPSIQTLLLQWNKLGNAGAAAIGKALECGAALAELDISHNDLTQECCESLARGLKCSRYLRDLVVSGNALGLAGAVMILSGVDPEGPMSRLLMQGCGLNPRDGLLVEAVAPESRGAPATKDTGKDNVEILKDVCPELLGTLVYAPKKPSTATGKGRSRAGTATSGKQDWVRPSTSKNKDGAGGSTLSRPTTTKLAASRPSTKAGAGDKSLSSTQKTAAAGGAGGPGARMPASHSAATGKR